MATASPGVERVTYISTSTGYASIPHKPMLWTLASKRALPRAGTRPGAAAGPFRKQNDPSRKYYTQV